MWTLEVDLLAKNAVCNNKKNKYGIEWRSSVSWLRGLVFV